MSAEPQPNHLVKGLMILGERWITRPWKWIRAGDGWLDKLIRFVMAGGPAYLVWRILSSSWTLLGAAVLVVVILALRAATKVVKGEPVKAKEPPGEPPAADPGAGLPEVPAEQFLGLLADVLGVAKGVHLRTLAAALTTRYGGAWEIADVRRLCEASQVPVTPTVRAPGGNPTVGVYRADLPLLPQALPEGAAVGPGLPAPPGTTSPATPPTTAAPTTPATPTDRRVGDLRIVAVDDPDNPARTHVTVTSKPRKRV